MLNEIDADAEAVLSNHFPSVQRSPDVRLIGPELLESAEMIVGGFPCQDVSIVGGQRGMAGNQTPLVKHVFRLVEANRPDWIFLENVQSIRFVHGGRVLSYVVNECERLGYSWAYRTLDSRAFGLGQRRRRLFFLASRVEDPGRVMLSDKGVRIASEAITSEKPIGFYWTEGGKGHGLTSDAIPPLKAGSKVGIASPPAVLFPNGAVRLPSIQAAEMLQGFPSDWTAAAPLRSRWRLIGNSVSPPVIAWIRDSLRDPKSWTVPNTTIGDTGIWPLAGWGDGRGQRRSVEAHEAPSAARIGRISEMPLVWTPISYRALKGFTSRARASNLRYPDHFLDKLEAALSTAV